MRDQSKRYLPAKTSRLHEEEVGSVLSELDEARPKPKIFGRWRLDGCGLRRKAEGFILKGEERGTVKTWEDVVEK